MRTKSRSQLLETFANREKVPEGVPGTLAVLRCPIHVVHTEQRAAAWWQVAALYAGIYLNAAFLESLASYRNLAASPWCLCGLFLLGLWLAFGVFHVPARSGSLVDLIELRFGSATALLFRYLLIPAWLITWFGLLTDTAVRMMQISLLRDHRRELSSWQMAPVYLIWILLVACGAAAGAVSLARNAVFVVKVSLAAMVGLVLSARAFLPGASRMFEDLEPEMPQRFVARIALWGLPALLFAGSFTRGNLGEAIKSGIAGVTLALPIAVLIGLSTSAMAAGVSVGFWKLPTYIGYANAGPLTLGSAKVLVMLFTLFVAGRFGGYLAVELIGWRHCWLPAITATTLLTGCAWAFRQWEQYRIDWTLTALPFAPLAGVLCAAHFSKRQLNRRRAIVALLTGFAVSSARMWVSGVNSWSNESAPMVVVGWAAAFGVICIGSRRPPPQATHP